MAGYKYRSSGGYTDNRNKSGYDEYDQPDEYARRPVLVDAEGRKRPIISYSSPNQSPEGYVVTTAAGERIVERVRVLPVAVTPGYNKYPSQPNVEPLRTYGGVTDDNRRSRSIPVDDRPEYQYTSPPNGVRTYAVTNDNRRSPSNPGQEYRPPQVEDFLTKEQNEVSRPTRPPGLNLSAAQWRNPPSSTGQGTSNGYGSEYPNYNNNNNNNNNFDGKGLSDGSRERPGRKDWTTPLSHDTPLSGPTNDIGTAMELLKEAVMPSSVAAAVQQPQFTVSASTVPKRDTYPETINSREASRRYGNFNLSSRPLQTGETYTRTIDSREAARRYNGARV